MKEMFKRWFLMLMNNRGETPTGAEDSTSEENTEDSSMEDLIEESLSEDSNEEGKSDDVSNENTENKEGADEEKSTDAEGEGKENKDDATSIDDPELEIDEVDGKKVMMKTSEIKSTIKWLQENRQSIAGSMQIRDLAIKHPEFGKLINSVIDNAIGDDLKINDEYVTSTLNKLEAKVEKIEEKIEEKDDDIEEAEAMLEELDPDSSQAMLLKKNIKIMKSQKAQLKDQASKIDAISEKIEGIDKVNQESKKSVEEAKANEERDRLRKVFDAEYDSLIKDKINFIDDGEKQRFNSGVRSLVADQSAKIKTDEDFKKVISESVKIVKKQLEDYHAAIRNDYLRKKGELKDEKKVTKEKTPPEEDMNQGTLEKTLEDMLTEGEAEG